MVGQGLHLTANTLRCKTGKQTHLGHLGCREEYECFLADEGFEDWLAEMSDDHAWGDELCVVRCGRLLQSPLNMLSSGSLPGALHALDRGSAFLTCTARGGLCL